MEQCAWYNTVLSRGPDGSWARPGGVFPLNPVSDRQRMPRLSRNLSRRQAAPGARGAKLDAWPEQKLFRVNSVLILREYA